jgi:hypothetical protein
MLGRFKQAKAAEERGDFRCRSQGGLTVVAMGRGADHGEGVVASVVRCGCIGHRRKRSPIHSATASGGRSIAPSQCSRSRKVESER